MTEKKYELLMVTKTHWDREWYMNFQMTRIKLVHLIDDLLVILDNDPEFVSFMLDGQTLPLMDYLEIRPQNRERLVHYVEIGRLVIGPWYILPDEILITGESHIRNYLMGSRIAQNFGPKMQIGYLPDSFGHPSQMPQILKKLGMDTIMFWRGATAEIDRNEFYWEAPDGTRVLTVLMPDGYGTGAEIPDNPQVVATRFDAFIEKFAPISSTEIIYVSNGGDHLEPVPYLSSVIKRANPLMKNGSIRHTTLPNFVETLKKVLPNNLKIVKGELCGVNKAILLASTLSTRTYLKQLNFRASTLLENYLEPIYSMSTILGNDYPQEFLLKAWEYLLKNLPHDSICGCSIDDVHRDMIYRYNQIFAIGNTLMDDARSFFNRIDTSGLNGDYALAVFNTTGNKRSDIVETTVDFDPKLVSALDFNDVKRGLSSRVQEITPRAAKPHPVAVRIFDGDTEWPCKMEHVSYANHMDLDYYRFPRQSNVNRCQVTFLAKDVPAMGYKTVKVIPVYEEQKQTVSVKSSQISGIENEFFRIEPDAVDGSINIYDKSTGFNYTKCNYLADSGDCGDEYSYCPPDQDRIIYAEKGTVATKIIERNLVKEVLEIKGIMKLPLTVENENQYRSSETVDCSFITSVTLYTSLKRIDIKTQVENKARYHRLRVLFDTGVKSIYSYSSGAFSVDRRLIEEPLDPNWQELYTTHPQKDFMDVNDGQYGLTIANKGLPEYEVFNDTNGKAVIAITLLRCVEEISRRYIKTRKAMGGWSEKAFEAQCIGNWEFEYSMIPHAGQWDDSLSFVAAKAYTIPMKALQVDTGKAGSLPLTKEFIVVENPELVVSSFKKCEYDQSFIFRFFNSTENPIDSKITLKHPVDHIELANLKEETISELSLIQDHVNIHVDPFSIITLKLII